jgi:hypothetical protein
MKKSALQDLCEAAELDVRSYSGRSMYGRECLAVEGESVEKVFANLIQAMADLSFERKELQEIADLVRNGRSDSMGRDVVVYWPSVPFCDGDLDEDEAPEEDCPESASCP